MKSGTIQAPQAGSTPGWLECGLTVAVGVRGEVLEGLSRMHPVRRSALMSVRDDLSAPRTGLSERELEIISLVATGLTNQEIGEQLMISKRTVDNHVSNIFTKTGAKNRVALLNWAMDNGKICRDGFNCCNLPAPSPGL